MTIMNLFLNRVAVLTTAMIEAGAKAVTTSQASSVIASCGGVAPLALLSLSPLSYSLRLEFLRFYLAYFPSGTASLYSFLTESNIPLFIPTSKF